MTNNPEQSRGYETLKKVGKIALSVAVPAYGFSKFLGGGDRPSVFRKALGATFGFVLGTAIPYWVSSAVPNDELYNKEIRVSVGPEVEGVGAPLIGGVCPIASLALISDQTKISDGVEIANSNSLRPKFRVKGRDAIKYDQKGRNYFVNVTDDSLIASEFDSFDSVSERRKDLEAVAAQGDAIKVKEATERFNKLNATKYEIIRQLRIATDSLNTPHSQPVEKSK